MCQLIKRSRLAVALSLAVQLIFASPRASADTSSQEPPSQEPPSQEPPSQDTSSQEPPSPEPPPLTWSYAYDGGAIPFIYGTALGMAIAFSIEPRKTPLWFSNNGGGQRRRGDTIPDYVVAIDATATTIALALIPGPARRYHIKGFLQAQFTAALSALVAKVTFGRHRPDFQLGQHNGPDARASFFSGHAASTLAQTTYMALYLRRHGFARARGSSTLPWWEGLTYAGLAAAAFYIPYSRVVDNRHNLSDVITGAGVGVALATTFFYWQDLRYRRESSPLRKPAVANQLLLFPDTRISGITMLGTW